MRNILLVVIISAMSSTVAGFWIFELDWPFLPLPLLAGLAMTFIQKEDKSYKYINKLLIGSLLYGFTAMLLIYTRMYLLVPDFPFWPLYNPQESLIASLVFSFVCFLGGLTGIVLKGAFKLLNKSPRSQN